MSNSLPLEVWSEILARLPVKTLLQLRSVCKLFNSVISSPTFISIHINKTRKQSSPLSLLLRYSTEKERNSKEHYLLLSDCSYHSQRSIFDDPSCKELCFPFRTRSNYLFKIVGSCNGLVCLSDENDFDDSQVILWNPSIKRFMNLPKPRFSGRIHGSYMFFLGFGYDEKSDDYKVVRVSYIKGRNGHDLIPPEVELYTLSSKSWRIFNAGAPPYGIYGSTWSQSFVNGAVHWVGYDPCVARGNDKCALVVSFDMSDEVFHEVRLPHCLEQCGCDLYLMVLQGKLALLQYNCSVHKRCCCVWIMQEYGVTESWIKLYSVDMRVGLRQLIGFLSDDQILGVTAHGKLLSYDPVTLRMKKLGLRGSIDAFHAVNYMDSLALLEIECAASVTDFTDKNEEAKGSDWRGMDSRNSKIENEEVLKSFHSVRIAKEDYPNYACDSNDDNSDELEKKLFSEDNCEGWEKNW